MVKIVTDSTADIPAQMVEELGIAVIPTYVTFGSETFRDGVDLSRQQFYGKLSATRAIPTTAAPPPAVYEEVYRRLAQETDEIVSIHLISGYSGLYNQAVLAARNVSEARIEVIDSGQVTMGYGWMVVAAAEAARRGEHLERICNLVEGMKPRSRVLAILDTFEYLYRGGRVDWMRSVLGTVLRIKPMIEVRLGQIQLVERARTMERSLGRLLDRLRALQPLERVIVLHANAAGVAESLADQLQTLLPNWDRLIDQAGVTIATHAGPGAVGIACVTAK